MNQVSVIRLSSSESSGTWPHTNVVLSIVRDIPAAKDSNSVKIRAPKDAEPGDILIIYIGGSASGNKIPSDPGKDWEDIIDIGKEDLNLKAYWKTYDISDAYEEFSVDIVNPGFNETEGEHRNDSFSPATPDDWKISDGKNTFVSIVALRGIDGRKPIVDADADEDTMDGREGDAKAPSVRAEKRGVVLACYIYDGEFCLNDNAYCYFFDCINFHILNLI